MLEQIGNGALAPLGQALRDNLSVLLTLAAVVSLVFLVPRILATIGASSDRRDGPGYLSRAMSALADAFTTNWQLTLLATTAFVLSVASGWTTWDGMRNFTGEPILSLMVTFGIQGVMLIIAWLIGESFASGMNQRSARRRPDDERSGLWGHLEPLVGMLVGGLCAFGLLAALANAVGAFDDFRAASNGSRNWGAFADKALYLGVGLLLLATLLINQKSDVIQPYLQSARVIARNAVLWVMFLSCMATSVFFSFDSLFSSIFPQNERKRAADIRAARQVAGVVNDIGTLAQRRQTEEAELLFRSQGWLAYEKNLAGLSRASQGAEQEIERYFVEKMEAHRRAVAEQQERMSSAKSGQAGLTSRKAALTDEISRMKGERPALAGELAEKKTELDTRNKNIDLKRVEAMAEERGAEGTLKAGKGPVYRQRKAELDQLQDAIKIQEERVRDAQKRMASADARIAQLEREQAAVDGDLAKLKGEADTAEQRIAVAEATKTGDEDSPKIDPARVRSAFERAHAEFRQEPTVERLGVLAGQCSQLLNAMASTPATKDRVRSIDCDAKPATEAAARVFALNVGLVTFAKNCAGGANLPKGGGVDPLLEFGRQCLQDSGLPSKDAGEMAGRIAGIDLNRDDKAHRFVVTWNAFADGNRLAYLALSIAIAIDSLVFMSGLFGANAIRSPLTDLEGRDDLTADQLEAAIDSALGACDHPRQTLIAIVQLMHPIQGHDGFTSEIILDDQQALVGEMRAVLNQASTIGAVLPIGGTKSRFLISAGLARYFAVAQKKIWKINTIELQKKELVNVIGVALLPDPVANADIVLSELHPISDAQGYAAEVKVHSIKDLDHQRLVRKVIGAGATVPNTVMLNNADRNYFVSTDFYKTLLLLSAGEIRKFDAVSIQLRNQRNVRPLLPSPQPSVHDSDESPRPLQSHPTRQLAAPAAENPSEGRVNRLDDSARGGSHQQTAGPSVPLIPGTGASAVPPPLPPAARPAMPPSDGRRADDWPRAGRNEAAARQSEHVGANLADEIRGDIIDHGGLHPWSERQVDIAKHLGAESEPEEALKRLGARAPRLGKLVGDTIDDNRASVREAYAYLHAHHDHDPRYTQVLETVAIELDELMPILMLTPGGPYQQILDRLIFDLEAQAGEGLLSPADDTLLTRARAQVAALKSLSDSAPDRYARMVRIIDQYDERGAIANLAEARAQKRPTG